MLCGLPQSRKNSYLSMSVFLKVVQLQYAAPCDTPALTLGQGTEWQTACRGANPETSQEANPMTQVHFVVPDLGCCQWRC